MNDEVFDDEAGDDTPEVVPDFTHTIAGVLIGFRKPKRGQMVALSRVRDEVSRELRKVQSNSSIDERVKFEQASRLVMRIDLAILAMVESMILSEADVDFVKSSMLSGDTDLDEIGEVLFGDSKTPQDDADPVPIVPAKKVARKAAARKVANANRTNR